MARGTERVTFLLKVMLMSFFTSFYTFYVTDFKKSLVTKIDKIYKSNIANMSHFQPLEIVGHWSGTQFLVGEYLTLQWLTAHVCCSLFHVVLYFTCAVRYGIL